MQLPDCIGKQPFKLGMRIGMVLSNNDNSVSAAKSMVIL